MTLLANTHEKPASDKAMASRKKNNVYTLLPAASVPAGHRIVGSRCIIEITAHNSHTERVVARGQGQMPGIDCGSTFPSARRLQIIHMVLTTAAKCNLDCWQLDCNTALLNANVTEGRYVKIAAAYE